MAKTILLISDRAEDASFLAEVSQVNGCKVHIVPDAKKAVDFIAAEDCTAIFMDLDQAKVLSEFEMEAQKRFGLFSDRVQPQKFHFISDHPLHENRSSIQSPFFGSFYQRPESDLEINANFYARFVQASEQMSTHDLKHFMNEKGAVQEVTLTETDQKQEAAEAVRQYLIKGQVPARVANIVANTVDELLMNALFDAPCDEFGKPLFTSTARDTSRKLASNELVKMSIGFDGFFVGISVTDQYGSVDRARLLSHVSMNYKNREYMIKQGQAGAGLGLANILQSGGSLIFHCESGAKTEVTLLYRVFPSYRNFKSQFRFFSAKFYV